tara:strand:+ start:1336 stop:1488 length:153 start_codon:yes stop_codon:yes gene_type:complete
MHSNTTPYIHKEILITDTFSDSVLIENMDKYSKLTEDIIEESKDDLPKGL